MSLAVIQRDMRIWLEHSSEAAAGRLGGGPGLAVYQNNYRAQLAACLETGFPKTLAWVGHEAFHNAVVAHVGRVPPSSWTLDAYPRDFPATLGLLFPSDAEIAELATLELALEEAFVGPDAAPIFADALGEIDWDRALLSFVPTLDLRPLTTNAPAIWAAVVEGVQPPSAETLPQGGALLVWRHGMISRFRAIDSLEEQAILLVLSGMRFAQLCTAIVDLRGEADGVALTGGYLGQWLSEGLLTKINDGDDYA